MSPLDPSSVIPFRAEAGRRASWRDGLGAGAVEAVVSLVLNVAVVASLVHLAFPRQLDNAEPPSITVELVPDTPKGGVPPGDKPAAPAGESSSGAATDAKPAPKPDVALPQPATAAKAPQPEQNQSPPAPAAAEDVKRTASEPSLKPAASPAAPAPIEGDSNPAPRLVAAPTVPQPAATQADRNVAANAETKPADAPRATERRPPPAPPVLASPDAASGAVPPPSSAAEAPHPAPEPSADEKRETENTARLAAAIPFAQALPPTFARAALPGMGDTADQRFRGEVYSQFHKADELIEQARAAHLRGQTVVEFAIDDTGALTGVRVAVSSGNPDIDRIAEDIIRRSAPFPPPPPGASHVFSPAIRLGLDD